MARSRIRVSTGGGRGEHRQRAANDRLRNMEPIQGGVVSIGQISGGDAYNILPERVVMRGTARWFRPQVGEIIERACTGWRPASPRVLAPKPT